MMWMIDKSRADLNNHCTVEADMVADRGPTAGLDDDTVAEKQYMFVQLVLRIERISQTCRVLDIGL